VYILRYKATSSVVAVARRQISVTHKNVKTCQKNSAFLGEFRINSRYY